MAASSDLEAVRIARLPDSAYYIPDFLTSEEEVKLLQKVFLYLSTCFLMLKKSIY